MKNYEERKFLDIKDKEYFKFKFQIGKEDKNTLYYTASEQLKLLNTIAEFNNIKKIAIEISPIFSWNLIRELIDEIFEQTDVEILCYQYPFESGQEGKGKSILVVGENTEKLTKYFHKIIDRYSKTGASTISQIHSNNLGEVTYLFKNGTYIHKTNVNQLQNYMSDEWDEYYIDKNVFQVAFLQNANFFNDLLNSTKDITIGLF